ncbi:AAA ATPase [Listeria weihenstephanensis FSL R9-0317]|uniref:ATPase n=1 Tax=Listeria weihenstephanensis TaxID=1006155 RepID=A0A1S7FQR9_9LIST|nr:AAA family ATPase [Listeria weihenstephanensis]AQY49788.1 ATPase [Listeria weihenstephanensis]EUJ41091.1 AAA ATPase [Listeria weihenstephanensis FSL R9-0317]
MQYVRCFELSNRSVNNPNIYPYNVLQGKSGEVFIFDTITILYGNNGSGKSTLLNILATKLDVKGAEQNKTWGIKDYFSKYVSESKVSYGTAESGTYDLAIPENSRYIKSEDILYEVKKIQQEAILREGYIYERGRLGQTKEEIAEHQGSYAMKKEIKRLQFAQEKYSNGETAMQIFEDYILPDGFYLLDEPESSLSPENQWKLAEIINQAARFLDCQFVIATHSPFLLGALAGTVYNLDREGLQTCDWTELENVRLLERFFHERQDEFRKR